MASLREEERSLRKWSLKWEGNGHVTDVVTLMEGQWSCYRGCQFNGGTKVMLQRLSV